MKRILVIALAILILSLPAMAAKVLVAPITHESLPIFQAYFGDSNGDQVSFSGYHGVGPDPITAAPSVFQINPGGTNWSNFVGAAQVSVPFFIKNITLTKTTPLIGQCRDIFPVTTITQQGTPSIRTWWPLMFEVPGTTFTLNIFYGTYAPYDDDGAGPNPAGYTHTEIWTWNVDATLVSLKNELALLHEVPFGLGEVPLISDEVLYPVLQAKLDAIIAALALTPPDTVTAGNILQDFESEVMDAIITTPPVRAVQTGSGTGIVQTECYPALCKLLADAEYLGNKLGILIPAK